MIVFRDYVFNPVIFSYSRILSRKRGCSYSGLVLLILNYSMILGYARIMGFWEPVIADLINMIHTKFLDTIDSYTGTLLGGSVNSLSATNCAFFMKLV